MERRYFISFYHYRECKAMIIKYPEQPFINFKKKKKKFNAKYILNTDQRFLNRVGEINQKIFCSEMSKLPRHASLIFFWHLHCQIIYCLLLIKNPQWPGKAKMLYAERFVECKSTQIIELVWSSAMYRAIFACLYWWAYRTSN